MRGHIGISGEGSSVKDRRLWMLESGGGINGAWKGETIVEFVGCNGSCLSFIWTRACFVMTREET